ncbi:hypothetical protein ACIXHM_20590 [Bacteroides fragilis]
MKIPVTILGQMSKGDGYLEKIRTVKRDIARVVKEHKGQSCLYYSFGYFESIFLCLKGVPYAYEISDIAYGFPSFGKARPLLRAIDRNLVKNAQFTLLTSEGFKGFLNQPKARFIVQPNKVNRKIIGVERKPLNLKDDHFIFSFVGSIRYASMMRFARTIGKYFPQHEFHFHGVANVESTQKAIDDMMELYPNIKLFGAFKNPDDFEHIYNSVDVVVVTYGVESLNETILDPNKLYEGIFFCRPLIATKGTFLAEQIESYGCGISIDSSTEEAIRDSLRLLTIEQLNNISRKEYEIEREEIFDSMDNLSTLLEEICKKRKN